MPVRHGPVSRPHLKHAIEVVHVDGKFWSIDNRRLYCAQKAWPETGRQLWVKCSRCREDYEQHLLMSSTWGNHVPFGLRRRLERLDDAVRDCNTNLHANWHDIWCQLSRCTRALSEEEQLAVRTTVSL